MKNSNSLRYRSLLARGVTALAISSLLLYGTGCRGGEDTGTEVIQPTAATEVMTTCTTSTSSSSTMSFTTTTTETETTTITTMAETISMTQPITESQTIAIAIEETPPEEVFVESEPTPVWTSEDDVILLAKLINHEASTSYDGKVMVGSCVVNRMNINGMSVSSVIFESGQFTTAYSLSTYNDLDYQAASQVLSQGSADSRIYFFDGCHGDGLNWFYDINYNYLGAW